ncbi:MAG: extracellular solute-binding protein [Pseudomonadota bacterium]
MRGGSRQVGQLMLVATLLFSGLFVAQHAIAQSSVELVPTLVYEDENGAYEPVYVSPYTGIPYQNSYGFLRKTKYGPDTPHFDYVNPDAPKGGVYRSADMGNWDSFNPIPLRGRLVRGAYYWVKSWRYLWDTLMRPSLDEPASYYGLIARGIAVSEKGDWVAFKLRDEARWHDGRPITVEDVLWTLEISKSDLANPDISQQLIPFTHAEEIGPGEVKFHISEEFHGDPFLPIRAGDIPIMPKHFWATRDIFKTTVEPILGSGPYKIGRFSVGRWVEWDRVQDYWAADLAPHVGHFNFDTVRIEYFRDDQVQTEAVKGHVIDAHIENVPQAWVSSYDTPAMRDGMLKRLVYKWGRPSGMWWSLFWNLDQERFHDIRVREALWLLSDSDWGRKRSYGFFGKATSFFTDSELAAVGLPSELELKLLEPVRHMIPPRVFTHPPEMPPGGGGGYNREHVLRASRLLTQAGWVVEDGVLVHHKTKQPFELRFLAVSAALGRGFVPYTRNVQRLGIKTAISAPEISNWQYRMRSGDFDVGSIWFLPENLPNDLIRNQFYSELADFDYSYNWLNLRDPAVDALINAVFAAQTWDEYVAAYRAFDRVMMWNFYFVPSTSKTEHSMAYWDKFGRPQNQPPLTRHPQVPTWWWDAAKAKAVIDYLGGG